MKTTLTGFIHQRTNAWNDEAEFVFHTSDMSSMEGYVTVMPFSFDFDIPADFDPRMLQVEKLKATKQKLMAEFQARCTEIERKISELTAITNEVAA